MALSALKQLESDSQKKKPEPLSAVRTLPSANPAAGSAPKAVNNSPNLHPSFAKIAQLADGQAGKKSANNSANPHAKNSAEQTACTTADDKDYRWTWLNPELEHETEQTKPSDIKQIILQDRTPELLQKMIALSCEQDEWCALVNQLALNGLTRQLALNSYLADKQGDELHLILKPAMAHLDNDGTRQQLRQALEAQGLRYQMQLGGETGELTPLERRRAIFEKMTFDAKQALLADPKLQLLREAFGATIDESTIRAVAE